MSFSQFYRCGTLKKKKNLNDNNKQSAFIGYVLLRYNRFPSDTVSGAKVSVRLREDVQNCNSPFPTRRNRPFSSSPIIQTFSGVFWSCTVYDQARSRMCRCAKITFIEMCLNLNFNAIPIWPLIHPTWYKINFENIFITVKTLENTTPKTRSNYVTHVVKGSNPLNVILGYIF